VLNLDFTGVIGGSTCTLCMQKKYNNNASEDSGSL